MAKQIEINDIITKVDTVKTKKLYGKKSLIRLKKETTKLIE